MKAVILVVSVALNFVSMNAQETQSIDMTTYEGDWYVIGFKPTFMDKNWINTKEHYSWQREKGYFEVVATYNKKNGGKTKTVREKVIPVAGSDHSKFIAKIGLFLKADYYIYKIAKDYSYVIVGHPKQKYLYIMARKPELDETTYQELVDFSVTLGYKKEEIVKHVQESQKLKVKS